MKFKKIIVLLTTVCMLGGLVACGGDDNTNVSTNDDQTVTEDNSGSDTTEENNNSGSYDEITEEVVRNHAVTDASEFEYSIDYGSQDSSGIMISKYLGTDTIVVIPDEIDGKTVTSIGNIFWNESPVQGVLIPNAVKRLGSTFANNQCVEVVIAEGVENLEIVAFGNCPKLHTVILSGQWNEINVSAFGGATALKEIYIAPTVDTLPKGLFYSQGEDFVIKGQSGSYAETYASENGLKFEAVE